jgi:hypothetical protein
MAGIEQVAAVRPAQHEGVGGQFGAQQVPRGGVEGGEVVDGQAGLAGQGARRRLAIIEIAVDRRRQGPRDHLRIFGHVLGFAAVGIARKHEIADQDRQRAAQHQGHQPGSDRGKKTSLKHLHSQLRILRGAHAPPPTILLEAGRARNCRPEFLPFGKTPGVSAVQRSDVFC